MSSNSTNASAMRTGALIQARVDSSAVAGPFRRPLPLYSLRGRGHNRFMKELTVPTHRRTELLAITGQVEQAVRALGVTDGMALVFVPHTTAGVTINENADPDVASDLEGILDRLVPWTGNYAHGEGNTAAHMKASLMGSSVSVPISGGRLRLGTWQGVFLCEFDGPRQRKVWVAVTPASGGAAG